MSLICINRAGRTTSAASAEADVDGVYLDWGTAEQRLLGRAIPAQLRRHNFAAGSMGPKIEAALDFLSAGGAMAGIGRLEDALDILEGRAGTNIAAPG